MGQIIRVLDPDQPLEPKHAAQIIKRLWREGRITWREHGTQRKNLRDFNTIEVEFLIKLGVYLGPTGKADGRWSYEIEDRQRKTRLVVSIGRNLLHIVTIIRL
jgi:hypothetical protein